MRSVVHARLEDTDKYQAGYEQEHGIRFDSRLCFTHTVKAIFFFFFSTIRLVVYILDIIGAIAHLNFLKRVSNVYRCDF